MWDGDVKAGGGLRRDMAGTAAGTQQGGWDWENRKIGRQVAFLLRASPTWPVTLVTCHPGFIWGLAVRILLSPCSLLRLVSLSITVCPQLIFCSHIDFL